MLYNISWQQLMIYLMTALALWYAAVGLSCYRNELKGWLKQRTGNQGSKQTVAATSALAKAADSFELAQRLRDELTIIFDKAVKFSYPKQELIMALQLCLRSYQGLNNSAFQLVINQFIAQVSYKQCSIPFSDDDLKILWLQ